MARLKEKSTNPVFIHPHSPPAILLGTSLYSCGKTSVSFSYKVKYGKKERITFHFQDLLPLKSGTRKCKYLHAKLG